jgi:hypothetical protein
MTRSIQDKPSSRRGRLWLVTSWLIARLWWSVEMSRLAVYRMLPKPRTSRVTRQQLLLPPTTWVCDEPRNYCLAMDEIARNIVILELPEISPN